MRIPFTRLVRPRAALLALWLAVAAALAGVAIAAAGDTAWSPVIYPAQRLPLVFSHAAHLGRGTPCDACHPDAATSRSAVDDLLPTEAACRACHPIDRSQPGRAQPDRMVPGAPPVACRTCHPGYTGGDVARVYLPPPPIKFDHAAHRSAPCATCHGDLRAVDLATTQHLPTMATCLACHRDPAPHLRPRAQVFAMDAPRATPAHAAALARAAHVESPRRMTDCSTCHR